jgi:NAD+ synthase
VTVTEKRINPTKKDGGPVAKHSLALDAPAETKRIVSFIRETVRKAGAAGVVMGLSGGIDSAVVCALCSSALGAPRILGLLIPSDSTPPGDMADARNLARKLGIRTKEVAISKIVRDVLACAGSEGTKLARANLQARVRMAILYFYANSLGFLVAGTGDRSEAEIGFFTKFGDGGVDFLPIAHLYKTQVRTLAAHLGVPRAIINKPSSPQLWPGHKATDEIPVDYDKLDLVLHYVLDEGMRAGEAAANAGVEREKCETVIEMNRRTAHKRTLPPALSPVKMRRGH